MSRKPGTNTGSVETSPERQRRRRRARRREEQKWRAKNGPVTTRRVPPDELREQP